MADIATIAGRAFAPADSPKTLLKRDAAMVRSESLNSSLDTPAN
jgi:hypothetical protein